MSDGADLLMCERETPDGYSDLILRSSCAKGVLVHTALIEVCYRGEGLQHDTREKTTSFFQRHSCQVHAFAQTCQAIAWAIVVRLERLQWCTLIL